MDDPVATVTAALLVKAAGIANNAEDSADRGTVQNEAARLMQAARFANHFLGCSRYNPKKRLLDRSTALIKNAPNSEAPFIQDFVSLVQYQEVRFARKWVKQDVWDMFIVGQVQIDGHVEGSPPIFRFQSSYNEAREFTRDMWISVGTERFDEERLGDGEDMSSLLSAKNWGTKIAFARSLSVEEMHFEIFFDEKAIKIVRELLPKFEKLSDSMLVELIRISASAASHSESDAGSFAHFEFPPPVKYKHKFVGYAMGEADRRVTLGERVRVVNDTASSWRSCVWI